VRFFFPNCWVRVHWMLVAFDESKNESKIMYTMKTRVIILVISGWFLVHSCRVASTYICFRLCFACGNNMMERLARTYKKRSDLEYMGSRATLENCAKTAHGKWKPHFVSSLFLPSDVWSFCRLPIVTRPCWIATSGAVVEYIESSSFSMKKQIHGTILIISELITQVIHCVEGSQCIQHD